MCICLCACMFVRVCVSACAYVCVCVFSHGFAWLRVCGCVHVGCVSVN